MAARGFARVAPLRAKAAFYALALVAAYLTWRLVDVQIRQGPRLAREAMSQRSETLELFAKRGAILDRDGAALVRSLPSESVYAVPTNVADPRAAAAALAPLVGSKPPVLESVLRERSQFRWLARKISHETAEKIRALNILGVYTKPEETGVRFAPSGHLASTVLGFVGMDEDGLGGIEYAFNSYLHGVGGKMRIEADQFGRAIPFAETTVVERARAGRNLELTLDSYLQFEAERALAAQVKKFQARSGTAIVMDPWTGEILALANVPDFEPAHFSRYSPDAWRDRGVMDAYEPGSTFKLITAAAALEGRKSGPDSRFPARDTLQAGGRTIHNAEDGLMAGNHGTESLEDIIAYSHNVGAAEVGIKTGPAQMYRTIRRFGFGEPTHVELPGENPGIVPGVADWSGSSLATISFGHGVSTTPLGLIRAYAAIANGGVLLRPRIVRALYDEAGNVTYRYPAEIERRAISARTAATLRRYLRAAVMRGTGNPTAHVAGYTTAGKTGTAQVVENGRYEPGAYIASFVGYIPADRPKFVILVKVERPRGSIYGSEVAAPVFAQLARTAMLHAGDMPAAPPRKPRLVRGAAAAKDGR
ncbi:MAG: peptidoglycan D,D-transpeptidase FtsI family protein [Candidatus Velthaea sp.]